MPNVSNIVKTIQDIMRKDAVTYGDAQRLEQLGWMFFLKIFDDREQEMALLRDKYKSPLPQSLRWSAWAKDEEGITGDALLDFVNNTLLPNLKALTVGGDKIAGLIRMAFEDANNYMKNGTLLRQVINKINGIDFNASDDRHMFGDIYEKLLKDLQSAGNSGEFYTPRAGIRHVGGIHVLRHCFATFLMEQNVDIYIIRRWMGHRSVNTTGRYMHVRAERLRKVKSPLDSLPHLFNKA